MPLCWVCEGAPHNIKPLFYFFLDQGERDGSQRLARSLPSIWRVRIGDQEQEVLI
jgi:hypothetical protein